MDWNALAMAVKNRRDELRLPQDLIDRGGPSDMTVRKIERAETTAIRNKTKTQLEHALCWADGVVDRILDGTAAADELNTTASHPHAQIGEPVNYYSVTPSVACPGCAEPVEVKHQVHSTLDGSVLWVPTETEHTALLRHLGWCPGVIRGDRQRQLAGDGCVAAVVQAWGENRQHPSAVWEPVGDDLAAALEALYRAYGPTP